MQNALYSKKRSFDAIFNFKLINKEWNLHLIHFIPNSVHIALSIHSNHII